MKLNFKLVIHVVGLLMAINGGFIAISVLIAIFYKESAWFPMATAATITFLSGVLIWFLTKDVNKDIKAREGYLIVTLGWLSLALTGSLPYIFTGTIPEFTNAFFETISGLTTTGASVLSDIESCSKGILFWRSLTQWIGGMGIIVLTVAILPILGVGGMQLFVAESPGPSAEKLHPRIRDTAKRLWQIYVGLTVLQMILLMFCGLNWFDAINHAMTTLSTGGFSTKNASIAHFENSWVHFVIGLFMFIAGANFVLSYFALKGNFKKIIQNEEFRLYSILIFGMTIIIGTILYFGGFYNNGFLAFRDAFFQVGTLVTTTGFVSADYTSWTPFLTMLCFMLFFTGACAGSTSGGIKMVRHAIFMKNSVLEFKRLLHPSAIIPVRYNNRAVQKSITFNILAFFLLYFLVFALGTLVMSGLEGDFMTALGATASSLGNVGPGLGKVGPLDNYAGISTGGKWVLSFLMLLGRLELFTVLIILTPFFWSQE